MFSVPMRALLIAALLQVPLISNAQVTRTTGFDAGRLSTLTRWVESRINDKSIPGTVMLVAKDDQIVYSEALGKRDPASADPMRTDAIFRMYSMTKPITSVALLMLYEEGRFQITDPLSKFFPAFADVKVLTGMSPTGGMLLDSPRRPITIQDIFRHTAGFTYGFFGSTPVDKLYQADNPLGKPSLKAFIDRMAKLPLLYQPGERWVYSVSVDIQGYLVEKLSGRPFPEFLRTRIFEPLGMPDTGFLVPKEQLSRVATIYAWDKAKNALVGQPHDPGISQMPGLPQGGGGLYSTAADYLRFAQMLLNRGELGGVRILKPASVEMMRTSVLSDQVLQSKSGIGQASFSPAQGFGYDFAVVLDPVALNTPVGKGTYWWWGAAGTWFWIDPANEVIFIGIIQRRGGVPGAANHETIARSAVYGALTKR